MTAHDQPTPETPTLTDLREVAPPPELEDRVVAALRARGLLARPHRSAWWRVAAALVIFGAGWGAGSIRSATNAPAADEPLFALLLYGAPDDAARENDRIAAYRAWAQGIAASGRRVTGERLEPGAAVLSSSGSVGMGPTTAAAADAGRSLQGFFIVSAASIDEASALARQSPHALAGGTIVVRPIDTSVQSDSRGGS